MDKINKNNLGSIALFSDPNVLNYFSEHKADYKVEFEKKLEIENQSCDLSSYLDYTFDKLMGSYEKCDMNYWIHYFYRESVNFIIGMNYPFDIMKHRFKNDGTCFFPTDLDTVSAQMVYDRFKSFINSNEMEKVSLELFNSDRLIFQELMDNMISEYIDRCVLCINIDPDKTLLYDKYIKAAINKVNTGMDKSDEYYFGNALMYYSILFEPGHEDQKSLRIFIFPAGFDVLKPFFTKDDIDCYILRHYCNYYSCKPLI